MRRLVVIKAVAALQRVMGAGHGGGVEFRVCVLEHPAETRVELMIAQREQIVMLVQQSRLSLRPGTISSSWHSWEQEEQPQARRRKMTLA